MSDPLGGYGRTESKGKAKKDRVRSQNIMSADDSVQVEAYGARGAAMRKTAAGFGEAQTKDNYQSGPKRMKESLADAVGKVANAIKSVVKTDRK